ncbi:MAG: 30S ribosomal protein S16 [Acidobacteria bacterium]|nr:MAG: 30S ribosomal protein S16 [Acidobacteriota bacterium]
MRIDSCYPCYSLAQSLFGGTNLLRIRLARHGAKKDPHYRVVVAERRSPRNGDFVEVVGNYNPALNPVRLSLDLERIDHWIGQGAQPTQTVRSLINKVRLQPPA